MKPSGIRRFFDIANEMEDVISLSIGEPDFSTPWHVREAGIDSLRKGKTWYTPNRGFIDVYKRQLLDHFLFRLHLFPLGFFGDRLCFPVSYTHLSCTSWGGRSMVCHAYHGITGGGLCHPTYGALYQGTKES